MTVRALTVDDVGWAVRVLAERRDALRPFAPVYWRQAADSKRQHADFMAYVLGDGGGFGFRSDDGLMVATPARVGWTVDDAWVPPDTWDSDGLDLWRATTSRIAGEQVRFVCPVPEAERREFALERGLDLATSWWHLDVTAVSPGSGVPSLDRADVRLVDAPPIYDPGGPITFVTAVTDHAALVAAPGEARLCGSPLVVVDQPAADEALARALDEGGYRRHCDFLDGTA